MIKNTKYKTNQKNLDKLEIVGNLLFWYKKCLKSYGEDDTSLRNFRKDFRMLLFLLLNTPLDVLAA